MSADKIANALGLKPLSEIEIEDDVQSTQAAIYTDEYSLSKDVIPDADNDETIRDIEIARKNIKNIIDKGDDALNKIVELANQSESPRAYEVASGMMKTLLDANRDFVDMSMKKKFHKEELVRPKESAQTNVTNNNLILSTADLLKMIKGESE
jgi:hypothetical protein